MTKEWYKIKDEFTQKPEYKYNNILNFKNYYKHYINFTKHNEIYGNYKISYLLDMLIRQLLLFCVILYLLLSSFGAGLLFGIEFLFIILLFFISNTSLIVCSSSNVI